MTSKDALEQIEKGYHDFIIKLYYETDMSKEERHNLYERFDDHIKLIEKELKILELFKKYLNVRNIDWDTTVLLGLELYLNKMPKEEVELLKEWLKYNCRHDLDWEEENDQ